MNECGTNKSRCHENAHCNNTNGDHNCTCNQGYEGDGFNCTGKKYKYLFMPFIWKEFTI